MDFVFFLTIKNNNARWNLRYKLRENAFRLLGVKVMIRVALNLFKCISRLNFVEEDIRLR